MLFFLTFLLKPFLLVVKGLNPSLNFQAHPLWQYVTFFPYLHHYSYLYVYLHSYHYLYGYLHPYPVFTPSLFSSISLSLSSFNSLSVGQTSSWWKSYIQLMLFEKQLGTTVRLKVLVILRFYDRNNIISFVEKAFHSVLLSLVWATPKCSLRPFRCHW